LFFVLTTTNLFQIKAARIDLYVFRTACTNAAQQTGCSTERDNIRHSSYNH